MHPSTKYSETHLLQQLTLLQSQKRVTCKRDGDLGLFCYTRETQYSNLWDEFTEIARGLVFDMSTQKIMSRPFSKFYNQNEPRGEAHLERVLHEKFRAYEKCDGSLIPVFYYQGQWRTTTKNSFRAPQAVWASEQLKRLHVDVLDPLTTYLFEAVYQQNRVVVRYPYEGLVLLGAYDGNGRELTWDEIEETARRLGVRVPQTYEFNDFSEISEAAKMLNANAEGFVVRFESGVRLKVKGEAYLRAHRAVSKVTPLTLWEMLYKGEDFEAMRKEIPEEFTVDFDLIRTLLQSQYDDHVAKIVAEVRKLDAVSNKDLGLTLKSYPKDVRRYVFEIRKDEAGWMNQWKAKQNLFEDIRPTENMLPGYTPGIAMQRVFSE